MALYSRFGLCLLIRPSVRLSVRPSLRPSVRPSVCPSVRPSVRPSEGGIQQKCKEMHRNAK
eukprot:6488719-Heterocapsa_arctica.AAC.1